MPKTLLQMDDDSRTQLKDIPEAGMSYYFVRGRFNSYDEKEPYLIAGDYFILPIIDTANFSLEDIVHLPETGESILDRPWKRVSFQIDDDMTPSLGFTIPAAIKLPPGYQSAFGALHLLGTTTLQFPANFYRFLGTPTDPRLHGGQLTAGTFLSTSNDHSYANTGFAAVGRYALPIPVPACHQFIYQLPVGTVLKVGTVLPQYGQAGGGVEVQLTRDTTVTPLQYRKLDEF